jgi:hypothetical protein
MGVSCSDGVAAPPGDQAASSTLASAAADGTSSSVTGTIPPPVAALPDPCEALTGDEVAQLGGSITDPMTHEPSTGVVVCQWGDSLSGESQVTVAFSSPDEHGEDYLTTYVDFAFENRTPVDVGTGGELVSHAVGPGLSAEGATTLFRLDWGTVLLASGGGGTATDAEAVQGVAQALADRLSGFRPQGPTPGPGAPEAALEAGLGDPCAALAGDEVAALRGAAADPRPLDRDQLAGATVGCTWGSWGDYASMADKTLVTLLLSTPDPQAGGFDYLTTVTAVEGVTSTPVDIGDGGSTFDVAFLATPTLLPGRSVTFLRDGTATSVLLAATGDVSAAAVEEAARAVAGRL